MRAVVSSIIPEAEILHALGRLLKPHDALGHFRIGARAAAVVMVLYERGGELCVPFVIRRPDLPDHPGQVALPGGAVKAGEDGWGAAAREAEEEIGVPAAELRLLGAGGDVYTSVSNFHVVSFVAHLPRPDPEFVHDAHELIGVLEVPLERLLDEAAWSEMDAWRGSAFEWEGSTIWGLTGRILADLLARVREAVNLAGQIT
jgi:8-oxo-dGTP pyrophosphatase MutT (NUDIX family)